MVSLALLMLLAARLGEPDASERALSLDAAHPNPIYSELTDDPVQWSAPPQVTAADLPPRAREHWVSGAAIVACIGRPDGSPTSCRVVEETPADMGFGMAAIRVVQRAKLAPPAANGRSDDQAFRVRVLFNLN